MESLSAERQTNRTLESHQEQNARQKPAIVDASPTQTPNASVGTPSEHHTIHAQSCSKSEQRPRLPTWRWIKECKQTTLTNVNVVTHWHVSHQRQHNKDNWCQVHRAMVA